MNYDMNESATTNKFHDINGGWAVDTSICT